MDIRPRRPQQQRQLSPQQPQLVQPLRPELSPSLAPLPITHVTPGLQTPKKQKCSRRLLFSGAGLLIVLTCLLAGGWVWYQLQLSPVSSNKDERIKVVIKEGSAPATIGQLLKDEDVIRSTEAFSLYTRLSNTQNILQAGTYRLSPAESTSQIVEHLTNGDVDTFNITFLPGATLTENRKVLTKAGYSKADIDTAFAATYDTPLFLDKPATSDLEGYIYGDTYAFSGDASVKDILAYAFDVFAKVVEDDDLVAKFKVHDLTLYQGITLASIVQRESPGGTDVKALSEAADIAQVFYNRLSSGTMLGSDVTYQYAADKAGIERDTNLDSPYNTRRYTGLPPGPIATAGKTTLLGTASPSGHDYMFFLSGDDDVTYFATDLAGHEANIAAHCKVKCGIL